MKERGKRRPVPRMMDFIPLSAAPDAIAAHQRAFGRMGVIRFADGK